MNAAILFAGGFADNKKTWQIGVFLNIVFSLFL